MAIFIRIFFCCYINWLTTFAHRSQDKILTYDQYLIEKNQNVIYLYGLIDIGLKLTT